MKAPIILRYIPELRGIGFSGLRETQKMGLKESSGSCRVLSQGSKYHYSSYLISIWAPKSQTILVLGPFGFIGG